MGCGTTCPRVRATLSLTCWCCNHKRVTRPNKHCSTRGSQAPRWSRSKIARCWAWLLIWLNWPLRPKATPSCRRQRLPPRQRKAKVDQKRRAKKRGRRERKVEQTPIEKREQRRRRVAQKEEK